MFLIVVKTSTPSVYKDSAAVDPATSTSPASVVSYTDVSRSFMTMVIVQCDSVEWSLLVAFHITLELFSTRLLNHYYTRCTELETENC